MIHDEAGAGARFCRTRSPSFWREDLNTLRALGSAAVLSARQARRLKALQQQQQQQQFFLERSIAHARTAAEQQQQQQQQQPPSFSRPFRDFILPCTPAPRKRRRDCAPLALARERAERGGGAPRARAEARGGSVAPKPPLPLASPPPPFAPRFSRDPSLLVKNQSRQHVAVAGAEVLGSPYTQKNSALRALRAAAGGGERALFFFRKRAPPGAPRRNPRPKRAPPARRHADTKKRRPARSDGQETGTAPAIAPISAQNHSTAGRRAPRRAWPWPWSAWRARPPCPSCAATGPGPRRPR